MMILPQAGVQLALAMGGSIIQNITQQKAGDQATQIGKARDVSINKIEFRKI